MIWDTKETHLSDQCNLGCVQAHSQGLPSFLPLSSTDPVEPWKGDWECVSNFKRKDALQPSHVVYLEETKFTFDYDPFYSC